MLSLNCLSLLVKAFISPLLTGTRLDGAAELLRVVAPFYQKRPNPCQQRNAAADLPGVIKADPGPGVLAAVI